MCCWPMRQCSSSVFFKFYYHLLLADEAMLVVSVFQTLCASNSTRKGHRLMAHFRWSRACHPMKISVSASKRHFCVAEAHQVPKL